MLTRCISAESRKLCHSMILPACLLIPIIPAIMGTFNYLQNQGILESEWYSLWTQNTLFYACFFFAPLIGLYCSYLWRLEHRHNNWNMIMTAPGSCILFIFCQTGSHPGNYPAYPDMDGRSVSHMWKACRPARILPSGNYPLASQRPSGRCADLFPAASPFYENPQFLRPHRHCLIGSVTGMLIINNDMGLIWPYSLMLLGMNSNKTEDSLAGGILPFLASAAVFSLIFCGLSVWFLKHRDVNA